MCAVKRTVFRSRHVSAPGIIKYLTEFYRAFVPVVFFLKPANFAGFKKKLLFPRRLFLCLDRS